MGSILALLSSICYGTSDFIGGYSTRRVSIGYVMICNQIPALAITCLLAFVVKGEMTNTADWLWSAAAGLAIAISVPALYLALGIGPMAVVAPVTALIGIVLPVIFGVAVAHERPSTMTYLGFVLGALAVVVVSAAEHQSGGDENKDRLGKGLALAVLAGTGIAAMYICLQRVSTQSGLLGPAVARGVSVTLQVICVLLTRRTTLTAPPQIQGAIFLAAAGCLDASATVLYRSALLYGEQLSIVATLVSLYPLTTVILATTILRERLTWQRIVAVALALSGIGLMVSGS
jgi:drug/metabolite transporter (DMT)-like permease